MVHHGVHIDVISNNPQDWGTKCPMFGVMFQCLNGQLFIFQSHGLQVVDSTRSSFFDVSGTIHLRPAAGTGGTHGASARLGDRNVPGTRWSKRRSDADA